MHILQLGCNDGKDKLFDYVKENSSQIDFILLVDANPYAIEVAQERYKAVLPATKFKTLHKAVVIDDKRTVDLYIPNKDLTSGHSSIIKDLTAFNWGDDLSTVSVAAEKVEYFLDMINNPLDQIHIDVEGLDADIIMAIDLNKYQIKNIIFEAAHTDGYFNKGIKFNNCVSKLTSHGYTLRAIDALDIIAFKQ